MTLKIWRSYLRFRILKWIISYPYLALRRKNKIISWGNWGLKYIKN